MATFICFTIKNFTREQSLLYTSIETIQKKYNKKRSLIKGEK